MLRVAPSGSIKRLMRRSILLFSSTQRIVVGSVAALKSKRKDHEKLYNDKIIFLDACVTFVANHRGKQSKGGCYGFPLVKGIRQV